MKCPVCTNVDLLLAERQGIEIDYCPTCRGVWLDRGELDKIIDRASPQAAEPPPAASRSYHHPPEPRMQEQTYHGDHKRSGYAHPPQHKKKKSLLSELFDFD